MALAAGGTDNEKLTELCHRPYKAQAVWFLNAYWNQFAESEADKIWDITHLFVELDIDNGKEGFEVDEFNAHRVLEKLEETLTVRAMRERLTAMGVDKIKMVPLIQYLIFRYHEQYPDVVSLHHVVNASQGDNQDEVEEAQRLLDAAIAALDNAKQKAEEARQAEAAAREAEAAAKAAQAELEAAKADLQAQEDAYNAKTEELKRKSEEGGIVSRNRAKNELAQHLGEDPLPLRRAKLNTDAAVRKAEKATAAAIEARQAAEDAVAAAEAAVVEAKAAVAEAQAFLDEVKSKEGSAAGALWWIDRELHEAKKYMPTSKGGIAK